MGGLAGHMSHLYENPSLTFKEIKDIFQKAASGKLIGTEKTDGQNLYISYSVRSKRAKAARNKGNIKDGGMTAEQLAAKFEGRGNIRDVFVDAFKTFEMAVQSLSIEDQIDIFGPDANIYYNAEIQDPRTANVINYDTANLTIHREGHAEFDKSTGEAVETDLSKQFKKLQSVLIQMQKVVEKGKFGIQVNAMRNLEQLSDKTHLQNALSRLEKTISAAGVSDNQTIAQYILNRLDNVIEQKFPNLPVETKKELLKRLMKVDKASVITVVKTLGKSANPQLVTAIKEFIKNEKYLLKSAILPIEEIVHDYSVELLRNLKSAFILDHGKEVQRLRSEVAAAIQNIQNSNDETAMEMLKNQLNKIKNIENISTAAEGFVFDYKGHRYKFTGNFAPINQILGIFKYGRVKSPTQSLDETPEQTSEAERKSSGVVVCFGRFNPPTIGHELLFNIANKTAQKFGYDLLIIPSRTTNDLKVKRKVAVTSDTKSMKNPLLPDDKVAFLSEMFPDYSSNIVNNPSIRTLIDVAKFCYQNGYKNFKIVVGSDRVADMELLKKYNNSEDYSFDEIEIVSAGKRDPDSDNAAGMSSTKMREAAMNGDIKTFAKGVAGSLSPDKIKLLFDKVRIGMGMQPSDNMSETIREFIIKSGDKWCLKSRKKDSSGHRKNLGCYPSRDGAEKREKQVQYFKHVKGENTELEEMNAAGAGVVQGHASPFGKTQKRFFEEGAGVETDMPDMISYLKKRSNGMAEDVTNIGTPGPRPTSGAEYSSGNSGGTMQIADEDALEELHSNEDLSMTEFEISRKQFVEELKLRSMIREAIKINVKKINNTKLLEENKLRHIIRQILREGAEDMPHKSTGINVLEELLKKLIPVLETDFKSLTTDPIQRKSFRAHILNAVNNSLATEISVEATDDVMTSQSSDVNVSVNEQDEEMESQPEDPKFIDIGRKTPGEEEEQDTFTIPGQDETGRNMALKTYDKIEKNILDSYSLLSNRKDQELFYDYLITNLKLYFDKFEQELNPSVEEPQDTTSPEQSVNPNDTDISAEEPTV